MRFQGKLTVIKVLSIPTGLMLTSLLYMLLSGTSHTPGKDRLKILDLVAGLRAVTVDLDPQPTVTGHWNESSGEREDGDPATTWYRPFVTITPNNSELRFLVKPTFKPPTCASSMHYRLLDFPWSAQYYHPRIRMVMTSANMNEFNYHRLEKYHMPYGFFYRDPLKFEDLTKVLDLFSTNESIIEFNDRPRPPCVSCAVVGNGGILNGSGMGEEIDSHDMVFRVNHCIRRGHESDVGTRTTHYVFMDRSLSHTKPEDIPKDKGIKWIFLPCRKKDYTYIASIAKADNPRQKLKAKAADIRILHPDFVRYTQKVWKRSLHTFRPSTGGMMLFTALHAGCDKLSVYGMGFNHYYTSYYYDKNFTRYFNTHDFPRETLIMQKLDSAGIIKWYQRDVPKFLVPRPPRKQ